MKDELDSGRVVEQNIRCDNALGGDSLILWGAINRRTPLVVFRWDRDRRKFFYLQFYPPPPPLRRLVNISFTRPTAHSRTAKCIFFYWQWRLSHKLACSVLPDLNPTGMSSMTYVRARIKSREWRTTKGRIDGDRNVGRLTILKLMNIGVHYRNKECFFRNR